MLTERLFFLKDLPAGPHPRPHRLWDPSINSPTFAQRYYLIRRQGNFCMSHPHTQASPSQNQPFEFVIYDHAYPLQTSSTANSRSGFNRPTGYLSLAATNWVCGETITSMLHIIARAEGWGLQAMPPQPPKPKELRNTEHATRTALFHRAKSR